MAKRNTVSKKAFDPTKPIMDGKDVGKREAYIGQRLLGKSKLEAYDLSGYSQRGNIQTRRKAAEDVENLPQVRARLEYLRSQIEAECISYDEIVELQSLKDHIDPDDVQLLEWAGVPEFPEDEDAN